LRRLFAVVKELIEWDLESTSHLLQGFNRGNGMTILDARDITPEKTRSLFDVTLGEFLVLAECAKAITNNHGCSPTRNRCKRVYCPQKYPRYVFMSTVEELVGEERAPFNQGAP
jgi:hypothetical protein